MKEIVTQKDLKESGCTDYLVKQLVKGIESVKLGRTKQYKAKDVLGAARNKYSLKRTKLTTKVVLEKLMQDLEDIFKDESVLNILSLANTGSKVADIAFKSFARVSNEFTDLSKQYDQNIDKVKEIVKEMNKGKKEVDKLVFE